MDVRGCSWVFVDDRGCSWVFLGVCGWSWMFVGILRCRKIVCIRQNLKCSNILSVRGISKWSPILHWYSFSIWWCSWVFAYFTNTQKNHTVYRKWKNQNKICSNFAFLPTYIIHPFFDAVFLVDEMLIESLDFCVESISAFFLVVLWIF